MMMSRAHFERLSLPLQAVVLIGITFPLFLIFALLGELSRGALAWWFVIALLNALHALEVKKVSLPAGIVTSVLLMLHLALVVWNPLRNVRLLGGLFLPIVIADYCLDYAVIWIFLRSSAARSAWN